MMESIGPDKSYEKHQKMMKNRLAKLGKDNPIVKEAIKHNEPKKDTYSDFEVVHELVSAAYSTYSENGNLKQCLKDLSVAIGKAANGASDEKFSDDGAEDSMANY